MSCSPKCEWIGYGGIFSAIKNAFPLLSLNLDKGVVKATDDSKNNSKKMRDYAKLKHSKGYTLFLIKLFTRG